MNRGVKGFLGVKVRCSHSGMDVVQVCDGISFLVPLAVFQTSAVFQTFKQLQLRHDTDRRRNTVVVDMLHEQCARVPTGVSMFAGEVVNQAYNRTSSTN